MNKSTIKPHGSTPLSALSKQGRRHALALCPALLLLAAPTLAQGYNLRTNTKGTMLIWSKPMAEIHVDAASLPKVGVPLVMDSVKAAFLTWTANGVPVRCSTTRKSGPDQATMDGRNMIRWIDKDWSHGEETVAITISWYKASTGEVMESDILANAQHYSWGSSPAAGSGKYDIQNVLAHEAGHFWGLGHSTEAKATMWPDSRPAERDKRSLNEDDRKGIAALIVALGSRPAPSSMSTTGEQGYGATGCSAAGDERQGGLAVLLAICLLLLVRHRKGIMAAAPLLFCLPAGDAEAGTRADQPVAEMTARAGQVFRGEVTSSKSRTWRGLIITDHVVRVSRCYKGRCGQTSTVRTLGGVVGEIGMHVEGAARLQPGNDALVFGRKSGETIRPLGMGAGVFLIASPLKAVRGGARDGIRHPAPMRYVQLEEQIRQGLSAHAAVSGRKDQIPKTSANQAVKRAPSLHFSPGCRSEAVGTEEQWLRDGECILVVRRAGAESLPRR